MDAEIETITARLDDVAEMTRFLASVPDSKELAKVLDDRKPVSTRAYEDETWTARFVESDGRTVMCFKIAPITIDQAEMIEMQWERNVALSETAFKRAVEQALGG
ncbi:MAG TPA: hypothetical protein VNZ02_02880 [Steroidobacteraceae bacterium]|jgi:hypothetical protein|nr:hypothetical protein [Steroidobacteraceae bacterium]